MADDLIVSLNGVGLYTRIDDQIWRILSRDQPDLMAVRHFEGNTRSNVVAYISQLGGLFINLSFGGFSSPPLWARLHTQTVSALTTGDLDGNGRDETIASFPSLGLFARFNDTSWIKLHDEVAEQLMTADVDGNNEAVLIADFSSTLGYLAIRRNQGQWQQLNRLKPVLMAKGDLNGNGQDELIFVFTELSGTFIYLDGSQWFKVHGLSASRLAVGDIDGNGIDDLMATFDPFVSGLFIRFNSGPAWLSLNKNTPDRIAAVDVDQNGQDDVIADFDGTLGALYVRRNQGSWAVLHPASTQSIEAGSLNRSN